ncbi:polygalacturonase-like [Senna tora]|uniref:Polygalacturonase-like n=1 Tax=Senna tora TaxID=362788 RepID=A0A834SQ91_9FABA|nr:polygalacturonase-like [Senna tora]
MGCNNVTFANFTINAPATSLNTDGIHIGRSSEINIIDSFISTGDDCISLGDGSRKINVLRVTCRPGHGISVGCFGNFTYEEPVEGTTTVSDLHYEDIIMVNVSNPILIEQDYCPYNQCSKETPSKINISKVAFENIKGTSATPDGVKLICSSGVPCEDAKLSKIDLTFNGAPTTTKCANVKPVNIGKAPSSSSAEAQHVIFDIRKYGASPNRDMTQMHVHRRMLPKLIPTSTYKLGQVDLRGPCKAPIEVEVDGIILAPTNPEKLDGNAQWVKFGYINFFTLSGGGTFDGQGQSA